MKINLLQFKNIIFELANQYESEKGQLNDLDQAIGDSDHGTNMARGFNKIKALWKSDFADFQQTFSFIGMTLMSNVGGASGPLYGMAFISYSKLAFKKVELNFEDYKVMVKAMGDSIALLGKSKIGEKTMVDLWIPLFAYLETFKELSAEIQKDIEEKIDKFVLATKPMLATKGRASFLKERSIGHVDAGSTSSAMYLKALLRNL